MAMDAASLISGAAGLFGSILNAGTAYSINQDQMWMARYGYDQQRQLIQEQNEYNSPAKQLERYKEAGLNPNLIYGNGASSAGNQSEIAKYQAPHLNVPQFKTLGVAEALGTMIQLKQLELQTEKTSAEVESMRMRNHLTERYIRQADSEWRYYDFLHGKLGESPAFENYSADIRLKNQRIDLIDLEKDFRMAATAGQKLTNQERKFYNDNLLPLMLEAKKMEIEGMSYENIIKRIDSETERLFRQTNIGSNPWRAAYGFGAILGDRLGDIWRNRIKPKILKGWR